MVYRCNAFFKCVDTRFEHASRVWKQWERTNKEKKRGIEKIKRDANRGKKIGYLRNHIRAGRVRYALVPSESHRFQRVFTYRSNSR